MTLEDDAARRRACAPRRSRRAPPGIGAARRRRSTRRDRYEPARRRSSRSCVALGFLIVIHELGHYLVARLCGVKVLRFSVGFGRPLWRRALGADRTEWVIAAFPLGGYVKMLDEREGAGRAAGAAARVQPAIGLAALRDRGRRAGRELPAGDRALLGPVHARRAGSEAGARRRAAGHARGAGRLRSRARRSCASATSRSRPGRTRAGSCSSTRWTSGTRHDRGAERAGAERVPPARPFRADRGRPRRRLPARLGLARFQPAVIGEVQAVAGRRSARACGRATRSSRRRQADRAAGRSWSPRVQPSAGKRLVLDGRGAAASVRGCRRPGCGRGGRAQRSAASARRADDRGARGSNWCRCATARWRRREGALQDLGHVASSA